MERSIDHRFKILLIGDSGVGKSSLLLRYCDNTFLENHASTIGVDFKVKNLEVGGKRVQLAIWDTAGQERFRTLTSAYYRGAHGVVLMYDATNRESFSNLSYWLGEIQSQSTHSTVVKLLVSTKHDRGEHVVVPLEEGAEFAKRHQLLFGHVSSKENIGVESSMTELVTTILRCPDLVQTSITPPISPRSGTSRCSSVCYFSF